MPTKPDYTKHWSLSEQGSLAIERALKRAYEIGLSSGALQGKVAYKKAAIQRIIDQDIRPVMGWGVDGNGKIVTNTEWNDACIRNRVRREQAETIVKLQSQLEIARRAALTMGKAVADAVDRVLKGY